MNGLLDMPNRLSGVPIIIGQVRIKYRQVGFPRSKKKRIRKKWAKDRRNWQSENDPYLFEIGNGFDKSFICDPYTFEKIRRKTEATQPTSGPLEPPPRENE